MNKITQKEIVIDVLSKSSEQIILFFRLENMGVNLDKLQISFLDNMLDLIGFQREPKEISTNPYYEFKDGDFSRDYICDKFFDDVLSKYKNPDFSEERKMDFISYNVEEKIVLREDVTDFVNWLYLEYNRVKSLK